MFQKIMLIVIAILIVLAMVIPVVIGRLNNDTESNGKKDPDDEN